MVLMCPGAGLPPWAVVVLPLLAQSNPSRPGGNNPQEQPVQPGGELRANAWPHPDRVANLATDRGACP